MAFVNAAVEAADAAAHDMYIGWCGGLHYVNEEKAHIQLNLATFHRSAQNPAWGRTDNQVLYQTPVSNYYLFGKGGAWARMGDDLHLRGTTPGGEVTQVYPSALQKAVGPGR